MEPSRALLLLGKPANATLVSCIPLESTGAPASCLEIIAKGIRSAEFSKDLAGRVAQSKLRQSSLKVYDSRWKGVCTWCSARRLSPCHVSVQQITEFLNDLFKKRALKVHTIKGYKSAIEAILKQEV